MGCKIEVFDAGAMLPRSIRLPATILALFGLAWVVARAGAPPVVTPPANQAVAEDAAAFVVDALVSPDGTEADPVVAFAVSVAPSGIVSVSAETAGLPISAPSTPVPLTITPLADAHGTVTVTLRATDEGGDVSEDATFTVTVTPVNDAPTVLPIDAQETPEDVALPVPVTVGDVDGDALTVSAVSSNQAVVPDAGLVVTGTGAARTLTITPVPNANTAVSGPVTITVRVIDGLVPTPVETSFQLTVTPVNDTPVFTSTPVTAATEDQPYTYAVTTADVDTPLAALTLAATVTPAWLVLTPQGTGTATLSGTPANADVGLHTVTLTVSDGTAAPVEQAFTVTVANANDAPSISDIADQGLAEDGTSGPLPFTVTDVDAGDVLTVTATSDNPTLLPLGGLAVGGTGTARTLTITPAADAHGSATVTVTVTDLALASASDTLVVTVTAVNDAPSVSPIDPQTTPEDVALAVPVTVGDVDGDALTVTAVSSNQAVVPDAGLVVTGTGAARTLTITPVPNANTAISGPVTITVRVSDGVVVAPAETTFPLTVTAGGDPPQFGSTPPTVAVEDAAYSYAIVATDPDADDALVFTAPVKPSWLVLVDHGNRTATLSGTPTDADVGDHPVTIRVTDGTSPVDQVFTVTVANVNDAPTVTAIVDQATQEDVQAVVSVIVGDVDTPLTSVSLSASSSNTAVVAPAGLSFDPGAGNVRTFRLTPVANASGFTDITVTASDGSLSSVPRVFRLTVTAVNDAPAFSSAPVTSATEDQAYAYLVTTADVDTPAGTLTFAAPVKPGWLTLVSNGDGTATLSGTPANADAGAHPVTLTVSDGVAPPVEQVFVVTVTAVNDAPVVGGVPDQTMAEDGVLQVTISVADEDSDPSSVVASATSSNPSIVPNTGLVVAPQSGSVRTLSITPALNATTAGGPVTITLSASDGAQNSAPVTFQLTITEVNDLPAISGVPEQRVNQEGGPTPPAGFTVGDVETPPGSLVVTASSTNTALLPVTNIALGGSGSERTVSVTPAAGQSGSATVTLTVSDGSQPPGTAQTSFVVLVNARPTVSDIPDQSTHEDTALTGVALTVGDAETPAAELVVTAQSSNGTLVPSSNVQVLGTGANRTLSITPAPGESGQSTITVTVFDGTLTAADTFVLTVTAVNDLPSISSIGDQATAEDSTLGPLAFTVSDEETPAGSLVLEASTSDAAILPLAGIVFGGAGGARTVTLTPAGNAFGPVTVTITVRDADAGARSTSFVLDVVAVPDAPTVDALANLTTDEDVQVAVQVVVEDVDTPLSSVTLSAISTNTGVVGPAGISFDAGTGSTRVLRLVPVANASGVTDITVTAFDGLVASAPRTFRLTVTPVNDAPTITTVANQVTDEDTPTAALPFTVGDVETAATALVVTATSGDAVLLPPANLVLGGSGDSRTVTLTPAPNQSGSVTVTLTVSDGTASTPMAFQLTVNAVNDAPTVSDIGNTSTPREVPAGPIAFTVGDVETPAGSLVVSATSSDPSVVPDTAITLGGSGANRTITLVPAVGKTGSTTITVTVTDGTRQAADTFVLTVVPANAPTISGLPGSSTTQEDTPTSAIAFSVGDSDGLIGPVTAVSSNPALVPNSPAGIAIGGGPGVGARTITLTPAANQFGAATITITAKDHTLDPALDAVASFTLTVSAVNDAPTLASIANQTTPEDTVKTVSLTVGDADPTDTPTVSAISSNTTLVPNPPAAGLAISGTGSSRTLTITPAANAFGTSDIIVSVSDGTAAPATRTFRLTVTSVNDAPTIGVVGDRTTAEDTVLGPIALTVGDVETAAGALTITRASSNTSLLPLASIALGGSGTVRTLTLTPAANAFGTADVTITVSDGALSTPTTFRLSVTPVNDAPTMTSIADQGVDEDTATPALAFSIGDVDDEVAMLQVSATSSDPQLVPTDGLAVAGTGASRTMTVTPAANRSGVTTITVTVRDDEEPVAGALTRSFDVTVNAVNDPPTISDVAPQQTPEDTPAGPIAFTIGDVDHAIDALTVTATSSNQDVVTDFGIFQQGTGTSRSLTIQPKLAASGSTVITVTVSDGTASAVDTFPLDVTSVPCAYTVTAAPLSQVATGGAILVDVKTNRPSCAWSVSSNAPWLVPSGSGPVFGDGAQSVTVAANPSAAPRSGQISAGGTTFTVVQAGASLCTYSLSPPAQSVGAAGGAASVTVSATGGGCGQWAVSSSASWLSVAAGGTGSGTATVTLAVAPNTASAGRSATLTLQPGGSTATLTQAGAEPCGYDVSPARLAYGAAGGGRALAIQTTGGAGQCAWSIALGQPAAWLTLSTTAGFGNGAVSVTAADNSDGLPREATVLVRDAGGTTVATVVAAQDSPVSGDADGDGLPSAWELQFGLDAGSATGEDGALGDPDGDGLSNLDERRNCDLVGGCTHPRGFAVNTRYLAEGATSAFFETRLALMNPGAGTATVLLRFQKTDGSSATQYVALPPLSRRTVLASNIDGLQQAEFSTLVEADAQVVVDRTMSWDRSGYGSHAETGMAAPRTRWYFAEGATFGNFDLFYLLQNPGDADAEVRVRYLLPSGTPVVEDYVVAAASRFNIWVDTIPALASAEVSAVIESTNGVPILAERAMYLSSPSRVFLAGHESAAVAEPRTSWFLAEGATGSFFDLFVLVANPNAAAAEIEARYLLPDGAVITRGHQVAPNSRFNIWVDFEDPRLANADVSTTITSTNGVPVIVERAMWWPGPTAASWTEAHNAAGATETGTLWALAEGEQGGVGGAETYVLVANTSPAAGQARVTLVFEDGSTAQRTFALPPNSRTNVAVGAEFPAAAGLRFGAIVESLGDTPAQIVVERAMYSSGGGLTWAAGTSAVATKLR